MVDEFGPELSVIGKRLPDPQGLNIVTGKYDFSHDHHMEGKLYGRILGSAYAHAKILSIDTSKAEALAGVEAVVTYKDNPLWSDTLRCVDQQVAAVAAVDEVTAERALDLIEVTYEVLPHVIDVEEAMKAGAPLAGAFPEGNISPTPSQTVWGDVAAGFTQADVVIDETVGWIARHTHNEIEPDSVLAWWEGNGVHIWTTTRRPFSWRAVFASALKMPESMVHVRCHGIGGSFGSRDIAYTEVPTALLSKKAGKPVQLFLNRRLYTPQIGHQWAVKLHMKLGAKNDGTLTAVESVWWADGGKTGVRSNFHDPDISTWKTPNYKKDEWGVATNKGDSASWRDVAGPPGLYLSDLVLEKMAAKLNINPLEFRRKVFMTEPIFQRTGQPLGSFGVRLCLEKVAEAIGYTQKYHAPSARTLPDGRLHGIGLSAFSDSKGLMIQPRGSTINMCEDGTITFNSGGTRIMGGPAAQAAIIAETIGVKYEDVQVGDWGSTGTAPEGGIQAGSTLTISIGAAMQVAAWDVRKQLFDVAAAQLKVTADELDAKEGAIFVKADPTKTITHKTVMGRIAQPVIGRGVRYEYDLRKPVGNFPIGTPAVHRTGCASACEVAVDPETGGVEILNFANAVDAGRVIERISSEGQVLAGLPIEYNQAILFDDIYDPATGRLLSFDLIDDRMCTALDIPGPDKNQTFLLETINACGPYGCQGIGEPAIATFASVTNAINNALGVWVTEAPATPMVILKALGKA